MEPVKDPQVDLLQTQENQDGFLYGASNQTPRRYSAPRYGIPGWGSFPTFGRPTPRYGLKQIPNTRPALNPQAMERFTKANLAGGNVRTPFAPLVPPEALLASILASQLGNGGGGW